MRSTNVFTLGRAFAASEAFVFVVSEGTAAVAVADVFVDMDASVAVGWATGLTCESQPKS